MIESFVNDMGIAYLVVFAIGFVSLALAHARAGNQ